MPGHQVRPETGTRDIGKIYGHQNQCPTMQECVKGVTIWYVGAPYVSYISFAKLMYTYDKYGAPMHIPLKRVKLLPTGVD